jgi:hypothetical protein
MGLLMTPQSFQKCIDDKISVTRPLSLGRTMCRWTCARSRVREDDTGHQNNGVSIRKKSFCSPGDPELLERLEVNAPVETRSIVPRSVDMPLPDHRGCGTPSQLSAWSTSLVSAALGLIRS